MQLKLNISEKVNQEFREYCEANQVSLSHGLSNLLMKVESYEELIKMKDRNARGQQEVIDLLKRQIEILEQGV